MVKQTKDYIKEKKKKHLLHSILWGSIMLAIFIVGLVVMKTRNTEFTLVAALFTLPMALNLTRYFAYRKFKDPNPKHASLLEHMKGTYNLYHSVIIPDSTTTLYFEHVVVTSRNIYFITKDEAVITKAKPILNVRLTPKGITQGAQRFIHASDTTAIKNACLKIQKDACFSDEQMGNTSKILEVMVM